MAALSKKRVPVNLLPGDDEEKTLTNRIIHWLLTTFRFLVITVELLVIIGFLSRFFLDSQNSDLSDEITQKKALISSYLPFEKQFKLEQAKIETAGKYYNSDTSFSKVINTVASHITSGEQLVSIQQKENSFEIHVQGNSEQSISVFTNSLKLEPGFEDVYVSAIETVSGGDQVLATITTSN